MKLSYGGLTIKIAPDGTFSVDCGAVALTGCRPELICDGVRTGDTIHLRREENEIIFSGVGNAGSWTLRCRAARTPAGRDGLALRMTVSLNRPAAEFSFSPLAGASSSLRHLVSSGRGGGRAESLLFPTRERVFSGFYTAMLSGGGEHLFCAAPLRGCALAEFSGKAGMTLSDFTLRFSFLHEDRQTADSGDVFLLRGSKPFALMTEWAQANADRKNLFFAEPVCGWSSWDYYRWTISEDEVLANADFIAHDPELSRRIRRIIIDDGWQYCYGEWEPNPLFPGGMEYLAKELTRMGFEPGLWVAPILAEPQSRIAQKHVEMLGMSEGGQPCLCFECMRRLAFVLDPTRADVCDFIERTFDRYAKMGYRYFKLDFLQWVLNARRFHDPQVPRAELLHRIVGAAYRGSAGRAELLGCNYLFNCGNEFVDLVRVGSDIHARWDHIRHNAVSIGANWHFNRNLWLNDPDFALARTLSNRRDPELNSLRANVVYVEANDPLMPEKDVSLVDMELPQAEVLLALILVSGGVVNCSDKLTVLDEQELALLRKTVLAEAGDAGVPLDLFETDYPSIWRQRTPKHIRLLFINWGDSAIEREVDPEKFQLPVGLAVDFWTGESFPFDGIFQVKIPPRACRFLQFEIKP